MFETNHEVVYEDATKHRTTLGTGFNPVLIMSAKVAFIAGRDFAYGEPFDCGSASARNWIALYDPASGRQERIFDRPLRFGGDGGRDFCVYRQMQLSHDGSKLYLVSPVAATAGSLAIVDLPRGSVKYAHGVNCVYIIETGPRRGELICQRRLLRKSADTESPHYPFVHASAEGEPIKEISDEWFSVRGDDNIPLLRGYLRKISGSITVNGRRIL